MTNFIVLLVSKKETYIRIYKKRKNNIIMIFWLGCIAGVFLLNIFADVINKESLNKFLSYFLLFALWIIASFRDYVGYDYTQYVGLYKNSVTFEQWVDNLGGIGTGALEPTIVLFIDILRENGFSYQSLFVVYATLTLFFFWMGIRFYFKRDWGAILFALSLFALNRDLFFSSLSPIRQALAMAICFYASQFVIKKEFLKYFLCIILAISFHYSAIFLLPIYFLRKINIKNRTLYFIVGVTMLLVASGLLTKMYVFFINQLGVYAFYLDWIDMPMAYGYYISAITFLIILFVKSKNVVSNFTFIMSYIASILYLISGSISIMTRLAMYFVPYFTIAFPLASNTIKPRLITKYIVLAVFSVLLISNLNGFVQQEEHDPRSNVEYEFNFNLVE